MGEQQAKGDASASLNSPLAALQLARAFSRDELRSPQVEILLVGLLNQLCYNPTSHKATTIRSLIRRAQLVCDFYS